MIEFKSLLPLVATLLPAVVALGLGGARTSEPTLGQTRLVSVSPRQSEGNDYSRGAAMSGDGRYVAFTSASSNLVPADTNDRSDTFLYDSKTNKIQRVSVGTDGEQANNQSYGTVAVSNDGRYVAFYSDASNLVPDDTNAQGDVFVRDTVARTTERISVSTSGAQGNGHSFGPAMTPDGRYVAFYSASSNLVPGDTNGEGDIFLRDRLTGTTERVSVDDTGHQANGDSYSYIAITPDARFVSFGSSASNLVPGDTNGAGDVFVRDRLEQTTERVNLSTTGAQANAMSTSAPAMTPDGRYIAFASYASNLVTNDSNGAWDVFVRDRQTNTTEIVSVSGSGEQGNGVSGLPSISDDGRYVSFASYATNFAPADDNAVADIFLVDRWGRTLSPISVDAEGRVGNGASEAAAISGDGKFVAFDSAASNLVHHDTNAVNDVFQVKLRLPSSEDSPYRDGPH